MPARPIWRGALHPVTAVTDEICGIFRELGFTRAVGPEAETERNNFTALNFPPEHPALDAQDSFYLGPATLLRTHTSPVQIRVMEAYQPPIRVVIPGRCYRRDPYDASHAPVFHQVEGLVVDEGITFVDLKAAITFFARRFLAPGVKVRFRPSFFPFTEPSAEVDVECPQCGGSGCPVCKQERLDGAARLRDGGPAVFEAVGIDASATPGGPSGWGLDRAAMIRYGVPDIRMLFDADMRFHAQFVDAP